MNDVTIIYYTSNREKPEFEAKIIENLKKQAGDLPIISVSQKPMDLGTNICVGEKPHCTLSAHRQLLIGLKEAKTKFALAAESDVLYPPEYFSFIPPKGDHVYRYANVWISYNWVPGFSILVKGVRHDIRRRVFWYKGTSEGAQMSGPEYWIEKLDGVLSPFAEGEDFGGRPRPVFRPIYPTDKEHTWKSDNPVVSFKTREGERRKTATFNITKDSLPYWGSSLELTKKYC